MMMTRTMIGIRNKFIMSGACVGENGVEVGGVRLADIENHIGAVQRC
jgi:hypothetical protein